MGYHKEKRGPRGFWETLSLFFSRLDLALWLSIKNRDAGA
jgi:hypothetical protein